MHRVLVPRGLGTCLRKKTKQEPACLFLSVSQPSRLLDPVKESAHAYQRCVHISFSAVSVPQNLWGSALGCQRLVELAEVLFGALLPNAQQLPMASQRCSRFHVDAEGQVSHLQRWELVQHLKPRAELVSWGMPPTISCWQTNVTACF